MSGHVLVISNYLLCDFPECTPTKPSTLRTTLATYLRYHFTINYAISCLPLLGDVHWVLDFIADGRMQCIVGALEGAASTSYRGAGYVVCHGTGTVVVEKWVVRTLVPARRPVCVQRGSA